MRGPAFDARCRPARAPRVARDQRIIADQRARARRRTPRAAPTRARCGSRADQHAGQPVGHVRRRSSPVSASVRAPKRSCAKPSPGPSPRATPRSNAAPDRRRPAPARPAGRGCCAPAARVDLAGHERHEVDRCARARRRAHLLCVPGSTASTRAVVARRRAPRICVSSPRITSGTPRVARSARPERSRARRRALRSAMPAIRSSAAGHSTYGASIQPWRLPIMPQAIRGAARRASRRAARRARRRSARRARSGCRAARCASPSTRAAGVEAVGARRRRAPVDGDQRGGRSARRATVADRRDRGQAVTRPARGWQPASAPPPRRRCRAPRPSARPRRCLPSSRTARASSGSP